MNCPSIFSYPKHIAMKIKEWAEEDRPREKMLLKGVASLSDAELLAILISSGNSNEKPYNCRSVSLTRQTTI